MRDLPIRQIAKGSGVAIETVRRYVRGKPIKPRSKTLIERYIEIGEEPSFQMEKQTVYLPRRI